jgi:hypothetical protein
VKDDEIKVTDKRMFTPEGELKEEYRFLEDAPPPGIDEPPAAPPAAEARASRATERRAEPAPPPARPRAGAGPPPEREAPPLELPEPAPGFGSVGFFDLAAALAEPASVYLGDVPLPGGQSGEDLEMARVHIDLLSVLRQKTMGNLSVQEGAFLDDLIYRLRMRYVQKRG